MAEKEAKVTTMVLKVDLQCPKCYKKVKKVLCKFPQIQDQVYNEKANTVTIKVVCCSPEKIRDKLCYKGGRSIKSIEIKGPEKEKPTEKPKEPEKPKEKPADKPKEAAKPKEPEKKPAEAKPQAAKDGEKPKPEAAKQPAEAPIPTAIPIYFPPPVYPGGPYFHGGTVVQYDGYYGRPVYDSWGGGGGGGYRGGYVNRDDYFSEENQQGCSIM